jgi:hypothetical protein
MVRLIVIKPWIEESSTWTDRSRLIKKKNLKSNDIILKIINVF